MVSKHQILMATNPPMNIHLYPNISCLMMKFPYFCCWNPSKFSSLNMVKRWFSLVFHGIPRRLHHFSWQKKGAPNGHCASGAPALWRWSRCGHLHGLLSEAPKAAGMSCRKRGPRMAMQREMLCYIAYMERFFREYLNMDLRKCFCVCFVLRGWYIDSTV